MKYWFAGLLALLGQLGDCISTNIALAHGAIERNPLMVDIAKSFWLSVCLKLGLTLLFLLVYRNRANTSRGIAVILFIAMFGFLATAWNLLVIYGR